MLKNAIVKFLNPVEGKKPDFIFANYLEILGR
jgi:hypothetical protein